MRGSLFLLFCAALTVLPAGCKRLVNRVPHGQPRGYVEFCPSGSFGEKIEIYEVTEDGWKDRLLGSAGNLTRNTKLRAALSPGEHRFTARIPLFTSTPQPVRPPEIPTVVPFYIQAIGGAYSPLVRVPPQPALAPTHSGITPMVAGEVVTVRVVENCLTPVIIRIRDHKETPQYHYGEPTIIRHDFNLSLTAQEPMPIK